MRILVVQESDWLEKGPHQSHHLMERLSERGHEIRVIDYEIGWSASKKAEVFGTRIFVQGFHKATNHGGVTVVRPGTVKLPVLEYASLALAHWNEIRRQIRLFRPDIIVGFGILNTYIAILEGRMHGIPVVYYLIDELHRLVPIRALQGIGKLVETSNMKKATFVLAINEGLLDYTIEMGARREKTEVVRAGVDPARFRDVEADEVKKLRTTLGFSDEDIVLFFMGWLYPFSGLLELATELAHHKWREHGIRLLIVGKGELRDRLQETIISNGLQKDLVLLDWIPYSEIPKYILASTVCILPSHNNDIMRNIVPIKMYEYLAAGKPVIATDIPGLRKEFGCGNGVIYVHNALEILQTAIDLSIRGRIVEEGERGRRFVEGLTWDQVTDRFESILIKIAAQSANAHRGGFGE